MARSSPDRAYRKAGTTQITEDIHSRSLATSTAISAYYYPALITPLEVIGVLNEANVEFMLVGTHAIGGWMQDPRCTHDVDLLSAFRHHKKAIDALRDAFPRLAVEQSKNVARFRHRKSERASIEVYRSDRRHFRVELAHTYQVRAEGLAFLIPSLELAVTMKFASMTSPTRELEDRYLDAHDFLCMIKANPTIDERKLAKLEKWIPKGCARNLGARVRRVLAGEPFRL
jgi:hypothetical protein